MELDILEIMDSSSSEYMDVDGSGSDIESITEPSIYCISINEIRGYSEWRLKHFSKISPDENHAVLFELPVPPKPRRCLPKWDENHVRLPYSIEDHWSSIEKSLKNHINTAAELQSAILSYNERYRKVWNLNGLDELVQHVDKFFTSILPKIIKLALELPKLIFAIPLLKRGTNKSISLSQQQIASLLANAFLCTFTDRDRSDYKFLRMFPDINFNQLFASSNTVMIAKFQCICNYFRRVCSDTQIGVVTFTRRCMPDKDRIKWDKCESNFKEKMLHVASEGTIEDDGCGLLQVDFANKYLGGGALERGNVQEEIRFMICPEMIVSMLITEVLDENEALIMIACERFSNYTGYGNKFLYDGDFQDDTPYDESMRKKCNVVAIDAINFKPISKQYKKKYIRRELDKAYVGFYHHLRTCPPGVATGNWGCGVFGGNKQLKSLLQLMACCVTDRPMVYFTFGEENFERELIKMYKFLVAERITVGKLWSYLVQFKHHKRPSEDVFGFIIRKYGEGMCVEVDLQNFGNTNFRQTHRQKTEK